MFLLRLPGNAIPTQALTGDAALDRYLTELDARLLGSAEVRLLTLAEVKDSLLERREHAARTVGAGAEAAQAAVRQMGAVEELAAPQREALRDRFFRIALWSGGAFGLAMTVAGFVILQSLSIRVPLGVLVAAGLFAAVGFGLSSGRTMAFALPPRRLSEPGVGDVYAVAYPSSSRAYTLLLQFALVPALVYHTHKPWLLTLLVPQAVLFLPVIWIIRRVFAVDADGFQYRRLGGVERVRWTDVKSIGTVGDGHRWVPEYWRRVKFVEYRSARGDVSRVNVYPDMANSGRLLSSIEMRLEPSNHSTPGSGPFRS